MNGTWLQRCSNDKYRGGLDHVMKKEESKAGFKADPNSNSLSTVFEIFLRRIEPWPRVDSNEILDRRISKLK